MKLKNKKRTVFSFVIIVVLLALFWYVQNFTFKVSEIEIASDKVTETITIVQLTDLHGASFGKNNGTLLRAIQKQQPDIICVTGDMYTRGDAKQKATAISLLQQATDIAPVYFVPGEHDNDTDYLNQLTAAGVQVLSYGMDQLLVRGQSVTVYGIDNVYYSDTFNLFYEFDQPSSESFNLLLAHIPNFEAFNWFGPDLTLCGDTHGGVVQLPLVGPLYFDGTWLPELTDDREYVTDKGLFDTYTGHVYVSGGLGNYPYPLRLFNRPEISVLRIVPKE